MKFIKTVISALFLSLLLLVLMTIVFDKSGQKTIFTEGDVSELR
jgi:hypothetical protein